MSFCFTLNETKGFSFVMERLTRSHLVLYHGVVYRSATIHVLMGVGIILARVSFTVLERSYFLIYYLVQAKDKGKTSGGMLIYYVIHQRVSVQLLRGVIAGGQGVKEVVFFNSHVMGVVITRCVRVSIFGA